MWKPFDVSYSDPVFVTSLNRSSIRLSLMTIFSHSISKAFVIKRDREATEVQVRTHTARACEHNNAAKWETRINFVNRTACELQRNRKEREKGYREWASVRPSQEHAQRRRHNQALEYGVQSEVEGKKKQDSRDEKQGEHQNAKKGDEENWKGEGKEDDTDDDKGREASSA